MSDLITTHVAYLRGRGYSPRTVDAAATYLRRATQMLPFGIGDVHPDEIRVLLADVRFTAWTRHTYDAILRRYFAWAYNAGEMTSDPMLVLPHPPAGRQVPNPVSLEEVALALALVHEPLRTAIMLATYAGLRADEIARLRREDVTAERLTVRVGKGGRPGIVDTSPVLWSYIQGRPFGYLILDREGRPVTGRWLSKYQRREFIRCGLPELHLHRFRHTFATELLRGGADIRTVQELMRHEALSSTMGYTLVAGGQRRAAVASLPELAGAGQVPAVPAHERGQDLGAVGSGGGRGRAEGLPQFVVDADVA